MPILRAPYSATAQKRVCCIGAEGRNLCSKANVIAGHGTNDTPASGPLPQQMKHVDAFSSISMSWRLGFIMTGFFETAGVIALGLIVLWLLYRFVVWLIRMAQETEE